MKGFSRREVFMFLLVWFFMLLITFLFWGYVPEDEFCVANGYEYSKLELNRLKIDTRFDDIVRCCEKKVMLRGQDVYESCVYLEKQEVTEN